MKQSLVFLLMVIFLQPVFWAQGNAVPDFTFEAESQPVDPHAISLQRGDQAMREKLYELACRHFLEYRQAVDGRQPEFATVSAKLTEAYLALGDLPAADKCLQENNLYPTKYLPRHISAWLTILEAQLAFKRGQWDACLQLAQPLLQDDSINNYRKQAVLLCADCAGQKKDWAKVIAIIKNYTASLPANQTIDFPLYSRLARAHLACQEYVQAEQILAAIEQRVDKNDQLSFALLQVMARTGQGQFDDVYALFQKIESRCPDGPDADWWKMLWELGELGFAHSQFENAEKVYTKASQVALNKEDQSKCSIRIADCQVKSGRIAQAKMTLENFRQNFSDSREYYSMTIKLAELLVETGATMKAAELFGEVAKSALQPSNIRYDAYVRQAGCFEKEGQYLEAIATFAKGAEIAISSTAPTQEECCQAAAAYRRAAQAAVNAKDLNKAIEYYSKLLEEHFKDCPPARTARFELAKCYFEQGKYAEAEKEFSLFVNERPTDDLLWEAKLKSGIAMRLQAKSAESHAKASAFLLAVGKDCPRQELAVQAFYESYRAAENAAHPPVQAVAILQEALQKYPAAEDAPLWKYLQIRAFFASSRASQALTLVEEFLPGLESEKPSSKPYSQLPVAAYVFLTTGDYYLSLSQESASDSTLGEYLEQPVQPPASRENIIEAQKYYSLLRRPQFTSGLVPLGMYESARCSFLLGQLDIARNILLELLKAEPFKLEGQLQTKVEMLLGDVLAQERNFEEAHKYFALARNSGKDSNLGYAALGRQAEMYRQLAVANPTLVDKAIDCLQTILRPDSAASLALKEIALYQLGNCLLDKSDIEQAAKCFEEVYLNYVTDRQNNNVREWRYYCLSVFKLGEILRKKGNLDSLRKAARFYEDLGNSNLPRSGEAKKIALQIRSQNNLGEGRN